MFALLVEQLNISEKSIIFDYNEFMQYPYRRDTRQNFSSPKKNKNQNIWATVVLS